MSNETKKLEAYITLGHNTEKEIFDTEIDVDEWDMMSREEKKQVMDEWLDHFFGDKVDSGIWEIDEE